ncbi:TPA: hypothetical protein MBF08_003852 [Klebsiella pneumoniae]|nr:hypothetical protein [Klebsiella pneumoniae]
MTLILTVITMLLALCLALAWTVIRRQDDVIESLGTKARSLDWEADRLRTDNEKIYRWLRRNGECVIDEMTCELDVLATTRQMNRDSYSRQLYLFDCLSLVVWNGMEGAEDAIRETVRKKIDLFRLALREKTNE